MKDKKISTILDNDLVHGVNVLKYLTVKIHFHIKVKLNVI